MCKRLVFVLLLLGAGVSARAAQSPVFDSLRTRFARAAAYDYSPNAAVTRNFITYSDYGSGNDVLLLQLYNAVLLPSEEVERLLSLFADGAWRDIDYADQTRGRWNPALHLTRLCSLAKCYVNPASPWCGHARLGQVLHEGLAYWCRTRPQCPNWWHNDIGVPKKLGAILLMLYDRLSPQELEAGLAVMDQAYFGRTGQNKVWLAANKLAQGLLSGDEGLVAQAREAMAQELTVTTQEGLQPDGSFHQHGPQIQFGNYGLTYVDVLSFWFYVLEGSPYAFGPEHYALLTRLMYEGIGRSIWRGVMDPSYCGRQNFINAGPGKGYAYAVAAQNMALLDTPQREEFAALSRACLEPGQAPQPASGPTYYYRSDCGIYRRPLWYTSIRMHSERTIGFEFTNRENTLANFSADGALLLMQHGREFENIFAHWDWRKVPGTTTYRDSLPLKCDDSPAGRTNRSLHVGGAVQGEFMATTLALRRDSLHALKSNFFFPDFVVALGTGIGTDHPHCLELTTALEQNHLSGTVVWREEGGRSRHISPKVEQTGVLENPAWLWHDHRGYVLLDKAKVEVSTATQRGKWDFIDPYYVDAVSEGRVFKCAIQHELSRQNNTYAYVLLPNASVQATRRFARKPPVRILQNTPVFQAVAYGDVLCAVFHQSATLLWNKVQIAVDQPVILILQGKELSLASPTGGRINLTFYLDGQPRLIPLYLPTDPAHLGETVTLTVD